MTQLSKLGLAGPCLEDSNWEETESLGCSVETWSQRLNKSKLGLVTCNGVRVNRRLVVSVSDLRLHYQISLVVSPLQYLGTEGRFSLAKIVSFALNH